MSNTIEEQRTVDGLGLTAEQLEQINSYATMRGNGIIPALGELLAEGLLCVVQARRAAKPAGRL